MDWLLFFLPFLGFILPPIMEAIEEGRRLRRILESLPEEERERFLAYLELKLRMMLEDC